MFRNLRAHADVGVRVRAENLDALFADAARGLLHVIAGDLDAVQGVKEAAYRLQADDIEQLLHDWLTELALCMQRPAAVADGFRNARQRIESLATDRLRAGRADRSPPTLIGSRSQRLPGTAWWSGRNPTAGLAEVVVRCVNLPLERIFNPIDAF